MNLLKPIWLVEDSADDIELTLAALEEIHLANRVIVMRDGSEVIERLRAREGSNAFPAVILLDIKMPKVSGIEVLRSIKGDLGLKNLPVVMLTSLAAGPRRSRVLRARSQCIRGEAGGLRGILRGRKDGRKFLGGGE